MTAALEWVVELDDQGMDPLSPYPTMSAKLQAFAQWFLESPQHQDAFLEAMAISGDNGETLGQIVTEFNRYNRRQIEVVDPSIARITVGGRFTTPDFDGFLETLRVLFHLRSVPTQNNPNDLELTRQENQ
jgi:ferric-dicitrate binding protein FerR (iron transport regulator)